MSPLFCHHVIILLTDNALNTAELLQMATGTLIFWCFDIFLLKGWIMSFILCIYCFYLEENWIINRIRKEGH